MPLLDERGRLFGKVNLIDAAVAVFVLLLVPLAYATYLLFKAPTPIVTSVEPRSVAVAKGATLEIKGEHLRPFFRAYLGSTVVEYLFATPDRAVLTLPELPAGDYEVILYDEAQEVARGGSVKVAPVAAIRDETRASMMVVGTFNRLQPAEAATLIAGARIPLSLDPAAPPGDTLEILGVRPAVSARIPLEPNAPALVEIADRQQMTAVVRFHGHVTAGNFMLGATRIVTGVEIPVPIETTAAAPAAPPTTAAPAGVVKRQVPFLVQRLYTDNPTPLELRVRFITRPEILSIIQRDVAASGDRRDPFLAVQPQILSLKVTAELDGETKFDRREGRIVVVDTMVRLPAIRTTHGWTYDSKPVRPGVELFLETPNWQMSGIVLSMEPRSGRVSP